MAKLAPYENKHSKNHDGNKKLFYHNKNNKLEKELFIITPKEAFHICLNSFKYILNSESYALLFDRKKRLSNIGINIFIICSSLPIILVILLACTEPFSKRQTSSAANLICYVKSGL